LPGTALITAHNPRNYGMYSVDLAAEAFVGELGLPATFAVTQGRGRTGRLQFERLRDPAALAGFDTVVYWGDFLNNPMWGAGDYAGREFRKYGAATRAEGFERWRALYLDVRRHHPAARVLALGGCFLGADRAAPAARKALAEFLEGAELVAPRDERSLEIVRALAPGAPVVPGIDLAWLLRPPPPPAGTGGGHFVWSLGRTLKKGPKRWIREVARRTGLRPVRLDWLNQRRPRFFAHWNYERMVRLVAGAEFVVTDTYHLVINSLLRGVRAVCIHDSAHAEGDGTLGDAKKPLLLQQVGMPELLLDVRGEDLGALAARVHDRVQAFGRAELSAALARFEPRREAFRRLVADALCAGADGVRSAAG
jgi:hypothetical protein